MESKIERLRISRIWMQLLPSLLTGKPPSGAELFLASKESYKQAFGSARAGTGSLTPPWELTGGQPPWRNLFWSQYLFRRTYHNVTENRAWARLLPLMWRDHGVSLAAASPQLKTEPTAFDAAPEIEAYLYPHGVAVIANLTISGSLTPYQVVEATRLAAEEVRYMLIPQGDKGREVRIEGAVDELLTRLQTKAAGQVDPNAETAIEPFTISTVIRSTVPSAVLDLTEGGIVHKVLDGLCRPGSNWESRKPRPLVKARLEVTSMASDAILYHDRRARVVWNAEASASQSEAYTTLCYHHNLTMAALQTESALRLARWAAQAMRSGHQVPNDMLDLTRYAVKLLGLLYGGQKPEDIYRSYSVRAHIEESGLVEDINFLRAQLQLEGMLR